SYQLFLTYGALQLLVVDLYKFSRSDRRERGDTLFIWLDALLCRVPGCAVLVVATHSDCFGENWRQIAAALKDLQDDITNHLECKRREWERAAAIIGRAE
ncbi:unnamed protein product, partial [Sphacelaria rigidula]